MSKLFPEFDVVSAEHYAARTEAARLRRVAIVVEAECLRAEVRAARLREDVEGVLARARELESEAALMELEYLQSRMEALEL